MANHVLLERIELNASAASVTFANIPQSGYTDLKVIASARSDYNGAGGGSNIRDNLNFYFNGLSTSGNWSSVQLYGIPGVVNGSGSGSGGNSGTFGYSNGAGNTTNTYGVCKLYVHNYLSNSYKSISAEGVSESNASSTGLQLAANLYSSNSAVTSITIFSGNSANLVAGSTFSLYGIAATNATPAIAPYASGGNSITTDGTYWYHTFISSGVFTPAKSLSCDYLVVAGGGGTIPQAQGYYSGGGGGGGLRSSLSSTGGGGSLEAKLSLSSSTNYPVTVGAGAAAASYGRYGIQGSSSSLSTIISIGGGYGSNGPGATSGNAGNGGSGGGAGSNNGSPYSVYSGGSGTSGQGYNGGSNESADAYAGGAGGGAGGAGGNGSGGKGGTGGAAVSNSISGTATYYAGGGWGGKGYYGSATIGDSGTGYNQNPNTGMGGVATNAAGQSGIVIVRYAV